MIHYYFIKYNPLCLYSVYCKLFCIASVAFLTENFCVRKFNIHVCRKFSYIKDLCAFAKKKADSISLKVIQSHNKILQMLCIRQILYKYEINQRMR